MVGRSGAYIVVRVPHGSRTVTKKQRVWLSWLERRSHIYTISCLDMHIITTTTLITEHKKKLPQRILVLYKELSEGHRFDPGHPQVFLPFLSLSFLSFTSPVDRSNEAAASVGWAHATSLDLNRRAR